MRRTHFKAAATAVVVLMLVWACGGPELTPTTVPPIDTVLAAVPAATLLPPTDTSELPSATPTSTETPAPAVTIPPLTDTPLPPSATPTPEPLTALSPAAANLQVGI